MAAAKQPGELQNISVLCSRAAIFPPVTHAVREVCWQAGGCGWLLHKLAMYPRDGIRLLVLYDTHSHRQLRPWQCLIGDWTNSLPA